MLFPDDTIVAIATPLGEGGLGVVRLSGPDARRIASHLFHSSSQTNILAAATHTLHHGWIEKQNHPIDEIVAGVFLAPHSYTGEDVVELSCHGSPVVLREIVQLCEEQGARPARPGEFTERAYLNGKMDLAQAEAVADLIHTRSTKAREQAAEQLKGVLSQRLKNIRDPLVNVVAHLEANLDFVEEDIPGLLLEDLKKNLVSLKHDIEQLLATALRGKMVRDGLRVVLIGRPNVGKSSLFNALLASDRAIVTNVPGTTRDTLEETLQWNGFAVTLTDTAGLRDTVDAVEEKGTERSRKAHAMADVVLFIVDGSQALTEDDKKIAQAVIPQKTIVVVNKSDKQRQVDETFLKPFSAATLTVSAKTASGLEKISSTVISLLTKDIPEIESTPTVTNSRHIHHLEKAQKKISDALSGLEKKKSEEELAVDLKEAIEELGSITGETATNDILAAIFSTFCIGK
jgi:tRNA modification GTPase